MANTQNAAFFEKYAPIAMEQQRKYGIPASVTLAQMALESGCGTSRLAVEGNNYFGIKCSKEWLAAGKPYSLHHDDKPNEKFCNYASVQESVDHHSQFLMGKRYEGCRSLAADDYRGWASGLQTAGYATDSRYASKLINMIESNGLDQYDRMAASATVNVAEEKQGAGYCLPLAGDRIEMTEGYGVAPTSYRNHSHSGIDLRAKFEDVFATENQGTVVDTGYQKSGGKYVTVEYGRADGTKWRVSYCHLDSIDVQKGDTVDAGTKLGVSGNTGNSTGPHLHLTVKRQDAGASEFQTVDPLGYLAEVAVRGGLSATVVRKDSREDLLAGLKGSVDTTPTAYDALLAERGAALNEQQRQHADQATTLAQSAGSFEPENILAHLLGLNGNGDGQSMNGDGLMGEGLISALFHAAIMMAFQLSRADDGNSASVDTAAAVATPSSQTEQEKASTLVRRQRESVDGDKARELAMMNFDAEYPEQRQGTGQRLV